MSHHPTGAPHGGTIRRLRCALTDNSPRSLPARTTSPAAALLESHAWGVSCGTSSQAAPRTALHHRRRRSPPLHRRSRHHHHLRSRLRPLRLARPPARRPLGSRVAYASHSHCRFPACNAAGRQGICWSQSVALSFISQRYVMTVSCLMHFPVTTSCDGGARQIEGQMTRKMRTNRGSPWCAGPDAGGHSRPCSTSQLCQPEHEQPASPFWWLKALLWVAQYLAHRRYHERSAHLQRQLRQRFRGQQYSGLPYGLVSGLV